MSKPKIIGVNPRNARYLGHFAQEKVLRDGHNTDDTPRPLPVPTHQVVDSQTGNVVGSYSSRKRAHTAADKKDLEYGAVRYIVKPIGK